MMAGHLRKYLSMQHFLSEHMVSWRIVVITRRHWFQPAIDWYSFASPSSYKSLWFYVPLQIKRFPSDDAGTRRDASYFKGKNIQKAHHVLPGVVVRLFPSTSEYIRPNSASNRYMTLDEWIEGQLFSFLVGQKRKIELTRGGKRTRTTKRKKWEIQKKSEDGPTTKSRTATTTIIILSSDSFAPSCPNLSFRPPWTAVRWHPKTSCRDKRFWLSFYSQVPLHLDGCEWPHSSFMAAFKWKRMNMDASKAVLTLLLRLC